jgi:hypothetical protein
LETNSRCRCAGSARRLADQTRQHLDHPRRTDAAVYVDCQPLLDELVGDSQALELLAVSAAVEHEVVGPHLVRPSRRLWPRAARSHALSRPLPRHLQTSRLPQPVSSPWAHLVSVPSKKDANTPIAKTRILRRQRLHPLDCRRIPRRLLALIVQRRSRSENSVQARRTETPRPRPYATCRRRAGTLTSNEMVRPGSPKSR